MFGDHTFLLRLIRWSNRAHIVNLVIVECLLILAHVLAEVFIISLMKNINNLVVY